VESVSYKDVDNTSGDAISQAIIKMSCMGVFNGFADGYFWPEGNVTRAQTAVLLKRIFDLKNSSK